MMKKITKFVTLLLALAMVFSLAACSSGKGKDKADGSADIATLIATEPNSADEAAKLYQQLMQKENDILAANSDLWNKVFLSANKNSPMIEDGTNYGDFLLATIESAKDGFWNDLDRSQKVQKRMKQLQQKCEKYEKLCSTWDDLMVICEMALEENDDSMLAELESDYAKLEGDLEAMRAAEAGAESLEKA